MSRWLRLLWGRGHHSPEPDSFPTEMSPEYLRGGDAVAGVRQADSTPAVMTQRGAGESGSPLKRHELKCWPPYFEHVLTWRKPFEVRSIADRCFHEGDSLLLREYDGSLKAREPDTLGYTGRACERRISYVLGDGDWGIREGVVVLGLTQQQPESDSGGEGWQRFVSRDGEQEVEAFHYRGEFPLALLDDRQQTRLAADGSRDVVLEWNGDGIRVPLGAYLIRHDGDYFAQYHDDFHEQFEAAPPQPNQGEQATQLAPEVKDASKQSESCPEGEQVERRWVIPICPGCTFPEVARGESWCFDCEEKVEWIKVMPVSEHQEEVERLKQIAKRLQSEAIRLRDAEARASKAKEERESVEESYARMKRARSVALSERDAAGGRATRAEGEVRALNEGVRRAVDLREEARLEAGDLRVKVDLAEHARTRAESLIDEAVKEFDGRTRVKGEEFAEGGLPNDLAASLAAQGAYKGAADFLRSRLSSEAGEGEKPTCGGAGHLAKNFGIDSPGRPEIVDGGEGELAYLRNSPKALLERYVPTSSVRELVEAATPYVKNAAPHEQLFSREDFRNFQRLTAALTRANELLGGDE